MDDVKAIITLKEKNKIDVQCLWRFTKQEFNLDHRTNPLAMPVLGKGMLLLLQSYSYSFYIYLVLIKFKK